jgi:flagellar hook-length control protein FliK
MPALPITPPTSARAAAAPKSGSPPPGAVGDFAALLDQTSARTAAAEGPKNRPARPESQRRDAAAKDDNKGAAVPDAQAAPVAEPTQPAAEAKPAEGTQGQPATSDPAGPTADQVAAVAAPNVDQACAAVAVPTPAPASVVAATMTPATTLPAAAAAVQAGAGAGAATAQAAPAGTAAPGDAVAKPAAGTPAGKLQIPAELLNANGGQTKDTKNGDQAQHDLAPAPTLPPTADAAAMPTPTPAGAAALIPAPAADAGATPVPVPAPSATAQPQPVATPQTAAAAWAGTGSNGAPQLSHASVLQTAERVQELVRIVATRAGNARAVLQLRPAELGQVDVHLRTTRNGLVATIAAHEQVGHDALQQAGIELRRTLEDKGVQLHSLDLQLGAGQNDFTNQGDAREANSGRRGVAASHGLGSDDPVAEDELTLTHAPSTPAGALVDVQA